VPQQLGVPTINLRAAADRHQRSRINNVNAHLRQNQWQAFRVNTGEGSLILEAQVFEGPDFQNWGLQNQVLKPWPLKTASDAAKQKTEQLHLT